MSCCARLGAWSPANIWSTPCSAASFLLSTAASICTSAKSERSWAIPTSAATTSRPYAAWDTSSPILACPSASKQAGTTKDEKPVCQDFSFLLDGASALPGPGHPRHLGCSPHQRDCQCAGAASEGS